MYLNNKAFLVAQIAHLRRQLATVTCPRQSMQHQFALLNLYQSLFEVVLPKQGELKMRGPRKLEDYVLVVYSQADNGVLLNKKEYTALVKHMSREDFETHMAVPVDAANVEVMEAILRELSPVEDVDVAVAGELYE